MAATSISVRRVLELEVPFTWQEAVALVHEAAIVSVVNATRNGAPTRLDADSCFITRRGDLELPYVADADQPQAALQLLRELLAGRDTPTDLEALAYGTATPDLTDDLAQFSRPNRRAEIAGLAMRSLEAEARFTRTPDAPVVPAAAAQDLELPAPIPLPPPAPAVEELSRLREQVAAKTPEPPPVAPEPVAVPATRRGLSNGQRVAATLALVLIGTVAWWQWSVAAPTPPDAPPPRLPLALAPVALDDSWHTAGRREADVDLGAAAPTTPAVDNRVALRSTAATATAPAIALAPDLNGGASPDAPAESPSTAAEDAAVDALFADDSVYSWTNREVQPALMRYPRMPRSSFPEPGERVAGPYFEVLVDQRGGVEAVRLRGPNQHDRSYYQARMMLSAAKAWQFAPARFEGRPVRYVVRVVPQ